MTGGRTPPVRALVHAWLLLDFFGEARRSGGDASTLTTAIFSQSFLAFAVAALLYPETPPVAFAAVNLCVSTLLVALGAFDTEQPLHRRNADRHLVGTAPLRRLPVVLARAAHASFATMLATIGMALSPAILLACLQRNAALAPLYLACACVCAGLAVALLSVALRWVRRFCGSQVAALAGGTGKALALCFGVALFALSLPALRADAAALPIGRLGADLLPPYHAARWLLDPGPQAWRLLLLGALGAALLAAALASGDGERQARDRVRRPGPSLWLVRRLAGDQPAAGIAAFTATMLWRSPGVRARVLPLLGVPAAIAFLALRGSGDSGRSLFTMMALQFPAIYLPFVVAMMQQADQQGSRWLFDSAPSMPLPRVQRAAWLALLTHVLLPVHALAQATLWLLGVPLLAAVPAGAFAFGAGGLVARAMVRELRDVPFRRDEPPQPGDFGNLLAYGLVLAAAGAAYVVAARPVQFAAAAAALLALGALARPGARR